VEFVARVTKALGAERAAGEAVEDAAGAARGETLSFVCEPKLDGVAVNLYYADGKLEWAATRGDGATGEDITPNARTVRTIPLELAGGAAAMPRRLEIRGEIVIARSDFARLNEQREAEGQPVFANPRNSARVRCASSIRPSPHRVRSTSTRTVTASWSPPCFAGTPVPRRGGAWGFRTHPTIRRAPISTAFGATTAICNSAATASKSTSTASS
jgi:hypothetical protein